QELGRNQQNNGGNGGDAAHKGGNQTAEEGILDQRQGDGHKHLEAVGAHIVSGFLNALVNLTQGGDAAAGAGGQGADNENDNQDGGAAVDAGQKARAEHAVDKASDIAHAQNRAGHRHGQHGNEFNEA